MGIRSTPFIDSFLISQTLTPVVDVKIPIIINNSADVEARRKYPFLECNSRGILSTCILKAEILPASLPEVVLPNYSIEDTESQLLSKTLQLQWGSPRYQAVIWTSKTLTGETWDRGDFFSILNSSGVPYVNYNILNLLTNDIYFDLGKTSRVAISFENVGWGVPKVGDSITLKGGWRQEGQFVTNDDPIYIYLNTATQPTQVTIETRSIPGVSTLISSAKSNRSTIKLKNNFATATLYYSQTSPATTTSTSVPAGTEAVISNYKGDLYAIGSVAAAGGLTITETVVV